MKYGAQSEYGELKTLLLHRPPAEALRRVTPETLAYYNFESPVSPDEFLAEFDAMAEHFRNRGVEVLFLSEVLKNNAEALSYISRRPNLMYMRDMASVTDAGAIVMNPFLKGRQWDGWVVSECFKKLGIPILAEIEYPGYLEGGGVGFLREDTCFVSICDRTTEDAVRQLAATVLGKTARKLVVVNLPQGYVHIDGLFMIADEKTAFIKKEVLDISPTKVIHADGKIEHVWFPDYLEKIGYEVIPGPYGMDMNYVVIRPGQVIGYDFCKENAAVIKKRGGEVVGIKGKHLAKGLGGVHCMTCPVLREK